MIFSTSPFSYGLIAAVCLVAFFRSLDSTKNPISVYFNRLFFWMFLYGLFLSVINALVLIFGTKLHFAGQCYVFGHLLILIAMFYGIRIFSHFLNYEKKTEMIFAILYIIAGIVSLVLNLIYPSAIAFNGHEYYFAEVNWFAGSAWFILAAISIILLAFIFWRQAVKSEDLYYKRKSFILAIAFSIIILGTSLRFFIPGIYAAIISEVALVSGMILAATQFFIKENNI
jgi:hypothetical protein